MQGSSKKHEISLDSVTWHEKKWRNSFVHYTKMQGSTKKHEISLDSVT